MSSPRIVFKHRVREDSCSLGLSFRIVGASQKSLPAVVWQSTTRRPPWNASNPPQDSVKKELQFELGDPRHASPVPHLANTSQLGSGGHVMFVAFVANWPSRRRWIGLSTILVGPSKQSLIKLSYLLLLSSVDTFYHPWIP